MPGKGDFTNDVSDKPYSEEAATPLAAEGFESDA
jgi:hypothetical protein